MKLQHKIAGTILLPLAAATFATSVQAADVAVYGRIQAHVTETTVTGSDMDFAATGQESRFGLNISDDKGVKAKIELNTSDGKVGLRHAYVTFDGITMGQTWKPSATTELLYPVLDPLANAFASAPSTRAAQVSTQIDAGAAKVSVGAYDAGVAQSAVPGLAAKIAADLGGVKVIAAVDMTQDTGSKVATKVKGATQMTAGVVADMGGMTIKGAFTSVSDSYTAVGGSLSMALGGDMTFNAAFDQYSPDTAGAKDSTAIWANVQTVTASGVTIGGEYSLLDAGYGSKLAPTADTSVIRLMANYNF